MASKLTLRQYIDLPIHPEGDFDHGDVYLQSGRVFIANTAAGTVEVVDGEHLRRLATIPGCPEASASTSSCPVAAWRYMKKASSSNQPPSSLV